jgi:two-component system, NarL family, sensor kinase
MKLKKFVFFFLTCLAGTSLAGQTVMNLDSLLKLLPKAVENRNKVGLLINIGQQYEANDPQKAGQFYRQAGKLSRKLNDKEGEISFINNYTYVLNILGQYDSSLLLNLQAVNLSIALNDSQLLGKAYFNTGTSYKLKGNIEEAAVYYLKGKNIFEKFGNDAIKARASDILQQLYFDMGQYQKAIAFGEHAIELSKKINDSLLLASAYNNVGMSYASIGENERAMNNYRMALATAKHTGNGYVEGTVLLNMADVISKRGDEKLTGPLYEQALKITREIDDREGEVVALRGLSNYHLSIRQPAKALDFALASYRLADSLGMRPQMHKTLTSLANVHFALQQIEVAKNYTYRANLLADSLNNEALQRNIADLEKKYETQKKDEQLSQQQAALRQQRFFNFALGGLAILLYAFADAGVACLPAKAEAATTADITIGKRKATECRRSGTYG